MHPAQDSADGEIQRNLPVEAGTLVRQKTLDCKFAKKAAKDATKGGDNSLVVGFAEWLDNGFG
jgi:hypothetical protein